MPTCGNCKQEGQTVQHIKECYANVSTVKTAQAPAIQSKTVPNSDYALERSDGTLQFFRVRQGKAGGRWEHVQFLDMLVGHPGDWARVPVKGYNRTVLLARIRQDPKAAAVRFSKHFTICAVCGSPLSDPESIALGLGPICAARF